MYFLGKNLEVRVSLLMNQSRVKKNDEFGRKLSTRDVACTRSVEKVDFNSVYFEKFSHVRHVTKVL